MNKQVTSEKPRLRCYNMPESGEWAVSYYVYASMVFRVYNDHGVKDWSDLKFEQVPTSVTST